MKILLYNPDNGVTRNFMPHLWMFLLQELTPPGHEVILIDGNAKAMTDDEIVRYVLDNNIELVGIGAMTRMVAKAYRVASAIRAAGVRVVMGGPHVTECPDEAIGKDGGAPQREKKGVDRKPSLQPYPSIPWESLDLNQFSLVPKVFRPLMSSLGAGWGT